MMKRNILVGSVIVMLAGCINTPNTKALITPIGGVGFHSFAPRDSQRVREVNPDRVARLDVNAMRDQDSGGDATK